MQPSLPIELLEPIVCQVQDNATLFALLLTSRAFHHDAEKALYRNVALDGKPKRAQIHRLASYLTSCERVAAFVQSLVIDPHKLPRVEIRNVLRLTPNLRSLSLLYPPRAYQLLLSDITNGTSFKLQSLDIGGYEQQDLKDFIHSQMQISSLSWLPVDVPSDIFPAVSDLSNITTLASSPGFLLHILPHCRLRRLHLSGVYSLTDPIPHLEVFSAGYLPTASKLATLFPNLRYLEGCLSRKVHLERYLQLPPRLERLRVLINISSVEPKVDNKTLFDDVQKLFENNANLWHVEIGCDHEGVSPRQVAGVKVQLLGKRKERQSETFGVKFWDWSNEWRTW